MNQVQQRLIATATVLVQKHGNSDSIQLILSLINMKLIS